MGIDNNLNDSVWIGLNDIKLEGDWKWIHQNNVTSYTNWIDNLEYERGNQDCASLIINPTKSWHIKSKWNDLSCEKNLPFICDSVPTSYPTSMPTFVPTTIPSDMPSSQTMDPTEKPSVSPVEPSLTPTALPTGMFVQ